MRWRIAKKPVGGDRRVRKCFAWLPVPCEGQIAIWLEYYILEEVWSCGKSGYCWRPYSRRLRDSKPELLEE